MPAGWLAQPRMKPRVCDGGEEPRRALDSSTDGKTFLIDYFLVLSSKGAEGLEGLEGLEGPGGSGRGGFGLRIRYCRLAANAEMVLM